MPRVKVPAFGEDFVGGCSWVDNGGGETRLCIGAGDDRIRDIAVEGSRFPGRHQREIIVQGGDEAAACVCGAAGGNETNAIFSRAF